MTPQIQWRPGYVSQWRDGELVTVLAAAPTFSSRIEEVLALTAADYCLTRTELLSRQRTRLYSWARFDAMTRLRADRKTDGDFRFSLFKIASVFGCDHTTVINGLTVWEGLERDGVRLEDWYSPFNDATPAAWVRAVNARKRQAVAA